MTSPDILYIDSRPIGDAARGELLAKLICSEDKMCGMAGTTVTAITGRDVQNLVAAVIHLQGCIDKPRQASLVPEPGPDVEYEE